MSPQGHPAYDPHLLYSTVGPYRRNGKNFCSRNGLKEENLSVISGELMSSNAYMSHRSPDMNNTVNIKNNTYSDNDNNNSVNIVNIAKLSHQSRTRTGSTSSLNSYKFNNNSNNSNNNNNAKSSNNNSGTFITNNNIKLYSKINFDDIPSLSTDIPRSAIHLTPLQFAHSVPIFRRERFDLFGLHGK